MLKEKGRNTDVNSDGFDCSCGEDPMGTGEEGIFSSDESGPVSRSVRLGSGVLSCLIDILKVRKLE